MTRRILDLQQHRVDQQIHPRSHRPRPRGRRGRRPPAATTSTRLAEQAMQLKAAIAVTAHEETLASCARLAGSGIEAAARTGRSRRPRAARPTG
ncbi:MAG: hypothetical protein R3D59_17730 [Paracoccaceae bacterium]